MTSTTTKLNAPEHESNCGADPEKRQNSVIRPGTRRVQRTANRQAIVRNPGNSVDAPLDSVIRNLLSDVAAAENRRFQNTLSENLWGRDT